MAKKRKNKKSSKKRSNTKANISWDQITLSSMVLFVLAVLFRETNFQSRFMRVKNIGHINKLMKIFFSY